MSTQGIANYLENGWWNDRSKAFYRADDSHHWSNIGKITYNFESIDQQTQELVNQAFERWGEIIDTEFESARGITDITVKESSDGSSATADYPAKYPLNGSSNPHVINSATINLDISSDTDTSQDYTTIVHEIGHAIGLGHAGPYNNSADEHPVVNHPVLDDGSDFSDDSKFKDDSDKKTVMSYFTQKENPNVHDNAQASPITPQIADIVAAKSIYGLDPDTRDGDTVYGYDGYLTVGDDNNGFPGGGFDKNSPKLITASRAERHDSDHSPFNPDEWNGNNASFTIYDAGGTDIVDMSYASTDQMIDLNPGQFSSVGGVSDVGNDSTGKHPDQSINPAITNNMTIAPGVTIEQAVGGSGDDILIGNDADNHLAGYKGNDRLHGKGGNDTFLYQAGGDTNSTDSVDGGAGKDALFIDGNTDFELSGINFSSIEQINLGDGTISLKSAQINGPESGLSDNLNVDTNPYPHSSHNLEIDIDANHDLDLSSWSFSGSTSNLEIDIEGSNTGVTITGSKLDDKIKTGTGEDVVRAGAGSDHVKGNRASFSGDQLLDGGEGEDLLDYSDMSLTGETDPLDINLEERTVDGPAQVDSLKGFENVNGHKGEDIITGDTESNALNGKAGDDILNPGIGKKALSTSSETFSNTNGLSFDELTGGPGADEFVFQPKVGPNNTITDFEDGVDQLDLTAFSDINTLSDLKDSITETGNGIEIEFATREVTNEHLEEHPVFGKHEVKETITVSDEVTLEGMTKEDLGVDDVLGVTDPTNIDLPNPNQIDQTIPDFPDTPDFTFI